VVQVEERQHAHIAAYEATKVLELYVRFASCLSNGLACNRAQDGLCCLQLSAEQSRTLKIKTGAVKRTTKEFKYYFKEKDQEEKKLRGMRDKEADAYDIKQQENVVQESNVMIPATKKSLEAQLAELKACIAELGTAYDGAGEQKEEADAVVAAADEALTA
jgi:tubulin-specific chaperone A